MTRARRLRLLVCLLGLTMSACAVPAPPEPAPAPPTPAVPDSPSGLVEGLLQKAFEDGTIQRLAGSFVALEGPRQAWIITRNVEVSPRVVTLRSNQVLVSSGADQSIETEQRFDRRGVYLGSRTTSRFTGVPSSELTVRGDNTAVLVETSQRRGEETFRFPWGDQVVPGELLFLLPRLLERGLPPTFRCKTLWKNGQERGVVDAVVRREVSGRRGVVRLEFANDPLPIALHFVATGPDRGRLTRLEGGTRPRVYMEPTAALAFSADLPQQRNEWAAIEALHDIRQAQHVTSVMRPGQTEPGPFAASLDTLRGGQLPSAVANGRSRGYRFALRRSDQQPTKRWMAVASPLEPGETGRYWYAITQEGKVFASKAPLKLNAACAIPPGALPVPNDD